MDLKDINELDLNNIGEWPALVKMLLVLVVCGAVVGGWYYWDTQKQFVALEKVEKIERDLRKEFSSKQAKAVNLEAYKQQLVEMQESFGAMLRQLPDKTEVAGLLVDVSQTGLAAGLEFELFQPQPEVPKDFYAELPIKIRVVGEYHEFGEFISGLAALPRIVTIHNVQIHKPKAKRGEVQAPGGIFVLEATAKTYRYLEEAG